MQRSSLYFTFGLLIAITVAIYGCNKRVNGIDNSQVIETPYSLFFSDTSGSLYNSNDGKTISKTLFKADGFPCRAICTVNSNILWAKSNLFISLDNGRNFNQSYDSLTYIPFKTCDSSIFNLNQSMIINISEWSMVFTTSNSADPANYLGVVFSLNAGGIRGSWWFDLPDTAVPPATYGNIGNFGSSFPITMTSYTYLPNGTLCGYDAPHNRNFFRKKTGLWNEVTANKDATLYNAVGSPNDYSGTRLPLRDYYYLSLLPYPDSAWYSYGHYNNRLIAIDNINCYGTGAFYSDDLGKTWIQYTGLPAKPLLCVASPFEEICMIGTDSAGLWYLNNNTNSWQQQTNSGLGKNLVVRNIAFKENVYKNGAHVKFIYLATNLGIYQSTDGGKNWIKTIPGNFVAVY